jgi:hypothetical protein
MPIVAADSIDQRRVQGDFGVQKLGNGTTGLGSWRQAPRIFRGRARHLAFQGQMDGGDGKAVGHLFERDLGRGAYVLGGELGLAEKQRQSIVNTRRLPRESTLRGWWPGLPSKRLLKPQGYSLSAPLLVEIAPLLDVSR